MLAGQLLGASTQNGQVIAGFNDSLSASSAEPVPATLLGDNARERPQTPQENRDRFQENQRRVAAQLLSYSLPVLVCVCLLMTVLVFAGVTIYIKGWMVWSYEREKPCDQPMQWWLLCMLLIPIIQCNSNNQGTSRLSRLQVLIMPIFIAVGAWLCLKCRTCQTTNPEVYQFVKMYLIFQTSVWVLMMCIFSSLVAFVFWMHRHGFLDSGPGPAMAAKPGLIDQIETVAYNPSLFPKGDDGEDPECAVCQDVFDSSRTIKKTSCGHYFHEDCLGKWLSEYSRMCPLCRSDLEEAMDRQAAAEP